MDDALREKILASLDLPPDSASDPAVADAIEHDPAARAYATALHRDDRALRAWPARARAETAWSALESRVLAALDADAKVRPAARVPAGETDDLAPPAFDDGASPMETRPAMSEPNEHDPDLENLAALTRTSLAPGGVPSVRPHAGASIADATDDTSSGIVDIKQLSAIARDAAASAPPPAKLAVVEAPKAEAKLAEPSKSAAKPAAKTDDVMVTAKPAAAAVVAPEAPRRAGGGPMWAIGGMAVMAGAFLLYNNSRESAPTSPSAVESSAPTSASPEAVAPVVPPETVAPSVAPMPTAAATESAPSNEPALAAPAPPPVVAPVAPEPTPTVEAAAQSARRPHAEAAAAPHHAATTAAARVAPTPAAAPTPARPAAAVIAAPAPTSPTAAAPTTRAPAAAAPAPAGRPSSVDDLLQRAAPTTAPAAAAAPAAPSADLPERLGRAQITGVLSPLNNAVRSCAQGQTGTAPVAIVIGSDGAVRSATVSGQFSGTPIGECIAGVVRRAHFPPFRAPMQNMMFPYVITPPRT